MSFRTKNPDRVLKKGISADESRRKREEVANEIRKNKREESLMKKRIVRGVPMPVGLGDVGSGELYYANDQDRDAMKQAARLEIAERLKQLPQLVDDVNSNDPTRQVQAVTAFRKLLSIERQPPIQEVIDSGVVPRLVQFLMAQDNPTLQFEAAWALTNVASGTTQHTRHVIDHGAVDIFVVLLSSPNEDVREQAVWALGNIAGDSAQCRDLVLGKGALPPLLHLCDPQTAKVTMLRNATWTLSNFTRGKPQPRFELVKDALPVLANIIRYSEDVEVLTDACWALSYLSDDTGTANTKIQAVISSGVSQQLVKLLMHPSPNVKTPALRTVGNIVTGDDMQTEQIINMQALPCLLALLSNPKKGIRKESCWTLSNITAGSVNQIQAVINAGLLPPLVSILNNEEFDIKKEAAWAISNATSGGDHNQIRQLVSAGVVEPMCNLFASPDPKIVMVAMEGIENILKVGKSDAEIQGSDINPYVHLVEQCGGIDKLDALQTHPNEDIYEKASSIIKNYIGVDDEEQPMVPATVIQGPAGMPQFTFGSPAQGNNPPFKFS